MSPGSEPSASMSGTARPTATVDRPDPWSRDGQVTPVSGASPAPGEDSQPRELSAQKSSAQKSPERPSSDQQTPQQPGVVVTGVSIPFSALVVFGIKLVLAAVPALLLLMVIIAGFFAIAGTLLGGAIVTMLSGALSQALGWFGWPW